MSSFQEKYNTKLERNKIKVMTKKLLKNTFSAHRVILRNRNSRLK